MGTEPGAASPLLALILFSCITKPDLPDADDSTGLDTAPPSPDMVLVDANNYSFTGVFDAPTVRTAELTDLQISWADVEDDIQCHPLDPVADIDNLAFMLFPHLTETEVEVGLSTGTLGQADLQVYLSYAPEDATTAHLTDLTFFGTDADVETFYAEGNGTVLLLLATGQSVGVGARNLLFVEPHTDETNTDVSFSDGCGLLDVSADLTSLTPLRVAPAGPWTVDWSNVTLDGQGGAINPNNIDQLMVAYYETLTPAELEATLFDLELLADDVWVMEHDGGTTAALDTLSNSDGPFGGFTASGTWLLALRCTLCPNPAPLFLGQVQSAP